MMHARFALARGDFHLDIDLSLPARGVTALWGPSGSGKTTLLRCIAGLESGARGRLEVDGALWLDTGCGVCVPTHRRYLGYVFQEASLFAHLDVRGNLDFGFRRTPQAQRRVGWDRAVELLDIGALLHRDVRGLSGGERQRVALARALLASPRLLLLDEPLAALDAARRQEILPLLERMHAALDIPVLYVSHRIAEVIRLADHVAILEGGRILGSGPIAEVLARPDLPLAREDDVAVLVEARVVAHDTRYELTRFAFPGGTLLLGAEAFPIGHALRLRIRARDVSLSLHEHVDTSILNRIPARVVDIADADHPGHVVVHLDAAGTHLLARITRLSRDTLRLEPNSVVWAQVKSVALVQ